MAHSVHWLAVLGLVLVTAASFAEEDFDREEELTLFYGDEESVSIATGSSKPSRLAPSVATVITADAIEATGADRVVTMDLHAPQIAGFYRIPIDDL